MEYISSVWMAASETSLGILDATQSRDIKIIAIPEASLRRNAIQPLAQRRPVGALTLFHQIYYGDAPTLLNGMLPLPPVVRRATRASTPQHTAAVAIPPSNTAGRKRTFLPTGSLLRNELPEEIFVIRKRDKFKTEVNAFLDALIQLPPPEWRGTAALTRKKPT